jgi:hypothetical protein
VLLNGPDWTRGADDEIFIGVCGIKKDDDDDGGEILLGSAYTNDKTQPQYHTDVRMSARVENQSRNPQSSEYR